MRAPFQVLVIPYRRDQTGVRFALLKRRDAGYWQFVVGGGEKAKHRRMAALADADKPRQPVNSIVPWRTR